MAFRKAADLAHTAGDPRVHARALARLHGALGNLRRADELWDVPVEAMGASALCRFGRGGLANHADSRLRWDALREPNAVAPADQNMVVEALSCWIKQPR